VWSWFFRATLPGDVPLWWAAAAGLYSNKGSTGAAIQSDVKTVIDGSGQFPEQAELRLKSYNLLSEGEILRSGQEAARLLPGAVLQFSALLPRLAHSGYAPIHSTATTLATPFRRAELPPATGLAGLPTLAEMVADFLAGARVPVASAFPPPWQPNPLLAGAVGWLGAGLSQLWGLFNRPPAMLQAPDWNLPNWTQTSFSGPRTVYVEAWGQLQLCASKGTDDLSVCNWWTGGVETYTRSIGLSDVVGMTLKTEDTASTGVVVGPYSFPGIGTYIDFEKSDGSTHRLLITSSQPFGLAAGELGFVGGWVIGYPTLVLVNGETYPPPLIPSQTPFPGQADRLADIQPNPEPQPLPEVPRPLPATVPAITPGAVPVVQPQPDPSPIQPPGRAVPPVRVIPGQPSQPPTPPVVPKAPPVVWPGTAPTPAPAEPGDPGGVPMPGTPATPTPSTPQPGTTPSTDPTAPQQPNPFVPIPGAQPIPNDGSAPVPAPSPTPITSPDTLVPWPGAKPIKVDQLAPPPTIEGIAKKTGEIEGKLDQIGGMLQPDLPDFDWGDALQGLAQLIGWLSSADPAGGYEISSPCETGPGSSDDPLVAEWGASLGPNASILKRLDAIAELLQHHKTLKQPSCKNPSPTGEVVTVQFEET